MNSPQMESMNSTQSSSWSLFGQTWHSDSLADIASNISTSSLDLKKLNSPTKNGSHALRCLHTFCTECLQQVVMVKQRGVRGYKCPTCLTFSPKGNNTHLFQMEEFFDIFKVTKTSKKCEVCNEAKHTNGLVKHAQWRCLHCKINLCDKCQKIHNGSSNNNGHKYVSCNRTPLFLINQSIHCSEHPGQMEGNSYCTRCNMCVCNTCMESSHKGHDTDTISHATEDITAIVEQGLKKIENDMEELQLETTYLEKEAKVIKDCYTKAELEYQENYESILEKLKKQYAKDMGELKRRRSCDEEKITVALEEIEAQIKDMKNALFLTKYALQNARGSSLIKVLTGPLHEKIKTEGDKTMKSHIMDLSKADYETDTYINIDYKCKALLGTPLYKNQQLNYEITKYCNGRQIGGSFRNILKNLRLTTLFNVNFSPKRIGLVEDNIWMCEIPNDDYVLDSVFKICIYSRKGQVIKTITPEYMHSAQDLAQVNETDVIAAAGNGLFTLTTEGELKYKILDGHFCYISTAGHKVASVNEDKNEAVILKYVGDVWQVHHTFKLHNLSEDIVSIHLVKDVLYTSEIHNRLQIYNLNGKLLEKYLKGSSRQEDDDITFRICGSDSYNWVLSTTFNSKFIHQVNTRDGHWDKLALEGVDKIEDICVKGDKVFVLQDCSDYNNFRYRSKVIIYEMTV